MDRDDEDSRGRDAYVCCLRLASKRRYNIENFQPEEFIFYTVSFNNTTVNLIVIKFKGNNNIISIPSSDFFIF